MNENVLAMSIVVLACFLTGFGLDDGSLIKSVICAYLGFLAGKRVRR